MIFMAKKYKKKTFGFSKEEKFVSSVQGLPDKGRKVFKKKKGSGNWAEVFKIRDGDGIVLWTTDTAQGETIIDSGWVKLDKYDKKEIS